MSADPAPCQIPGDAPVSNRPPWADHPRADAKDKLARFVRLTPQETPFPYIVRRVFGPDTPIDGADARLARRLFENHSERFRITEKDGMRWVRPTDAFAVLKSSRQDPSLAPESAGAPTGFLPDRGPSGRAARVARSILRDRCRITPGPEAAGVRGALVHALAAHREGVDTPGMRSDRVSAPSRVAARQAAFVGAFEAAAQAHGHRHRRGVLLTLTARPGESGDLIDTAVAVNDSVGPLRDHLARQTPGSGRPPAVVVREVTGAGVLHLHVVAFGVGPDAIDRDALGRYWHEQRGHGYVVDVAGIERRPARTPTGRGVRWTFADHATAPRIGAATSGPTWEICYTGSVRSRRRRPRSCTRSPRTAAGRGGKWPSCGRAACLL